MTPRRLSSSLEREIDGDCGTMNTESYPRTKHRRITVVFRIILIVAGIVAVSIGIAGLLGFVDIDAMGSLFLAGLGVVWVLGGIFKADVIEYMV